ncbi:calmodulin-binding carboxy-terminal kinesin isoform X2 [Strongylocentrotus purpuratus]|uniref:Kinesin motor domain-containing protein n=1 Tax=Strongylocentrotus purpuratus TaxID=7668 RepID=A0A7M7NAJ1_STRPU|nr:calmodulin-binding carboxy-terminal kinesin isoform X2 [Strongylocentrotus purpuratus]
MATTQRSANRKKKTVPRVAPTLNPKAEIERPPSAASHNSWLGQDIDGDEEIDRVSTPVQRLTPVSGSLTSVRDFENDGLTSGHRPLSPRAPSPGNLLERPITPSSGRLSPLDGIMGKKKSKVMPTEDDLPNVDSVRHTPEPMEAWSDQSMADLHDDTGHRPKTAQKTRSSSRTRTPGEGGHTGSVPSMHSVISVREASEDHRISGVMEGRRSPAVMPSTSARHEEDNRSLVSTTSRSRVTPPQMEHEQQAYVPFVYARDCIARVMEDMKKMKGNHIRIVHEIQDSYRQIEDQTQDQFNGFVINLRSQYKDKVVTFRQVIEVHRKELGSHKSYWEQTLMSLSQRNKELMKEKKRLLIINKVEIERLEKEKVELTSTLTQQTDKEHQHFIATKKELEGSNEEKKIIQDELQTEKEEVERLRAELAASKSSSYSSGGDVVVPVVAAIERSASRSSSSRVEVAPVPVVVGSGLGEEERQRLQDEKAEMQDKYIESQKEYVILQSKYASLESQFQMVAKAASAGDGNKMEEQIESLKNDQESMKQEEEELTEEINTWEDDFKEKNGREPTEEETPMSVRELQTQLDEVQNMQSDLGSKVTTLTAIKEGNIPEPEAVSAPEPIIKTVEVTVPDPTTVAALAMAQKRIAKLEAQVKTLQASLQKEMKKQKKEKASVARTKKDDKEEKNLRLLLQAVLRQVHEINDEEITPKERVATRLEEAELAKPSLLEGRDKAKEEADGSTDYDSFNAANQKVLTNETDIIALTMIQTGAVPEELGGMMTPQVIVAGGGGGGDSGGVSSEEMEELQARITELEEENESLTDSNRELEETKEDMEEKIEDLKARIKELEDAEGASGAGAAAAAFAMANLDLDDDDMQGMSGQMTALQMKIDSVEKELLKEKEAHSKTKEEVETLEEDIERLKAEKADNSAGGDAKGEAARAALVAEMALQTKQISGFEKKIEALEQEKLKNIPPDTAKEINSLYSKVKELERQRDAAQKEAIAKTAEASKITVDFSSTQKFLEKEREANKKHQATLKTKMAEKDKHAKELVATTEKKFTERLEQNKNQITALEKKVKTLSAAGAVGGAKAGGAKTDAKTEKKIQMLQDQNAALKKQVQEEQARAKQFKDDVKEAKAAGAGDKNATKKIEKQIKDLEKKLEMETKKHEREAKKATEFEAELKTTTKDRDSLKDEVAKLMAQISSLGVAAEEALELKEKCTTLEKENKELQKELKAATDNYNSERVLRKKYYNMVEDMKGKIRVYCRARPLSGSEKERGNFSIIKRPDEYTVDITSTRGQKEFQFDHIFMPENTQAEIFEDTDRLIQSAVDGYNVCIFAYGQTGSGKTFTMIGDKEQKFPGIAPRAFQKVYELIEENKSKFSFRVYTYMLELYNEKLIDLYNKNKGEPPKLDIKKDKKGMVYINGSVIQEAGNSKELYGLFEEGSANRHVASTKMNSESSRSHLVIGVIIESTNLGTGAVVKGKLTLVDLAGSERSAKTGATAEQLKEANSINKSLSALADVISALSSEQSFIPYRNNKLTMLMQDSLGGNAKTLMFVNISPADYNAEETVISLTYASRVKLITNDASKNSDNKEIARLKDVIAKLKKGETLDEEEVE